MKENCVCSLFFARRGRSGTDSCPCGPPARELPQDLTVYSTINYSHISSACLIGTFSQQCSVDTKKPDTRAPAMVCSEQRQNYHRQDIGHKCKN